MIVTDGLNFRERFPDLVSHSVLIQTTNFMSVFKYNGRWNRHCCEQFHVETSLFKYATMQMEAYINLTSQLSEGGFFTKKNCSYIKMLTTGFEDLECHQNLEGNNQHFWIWDELGNRLKSDVYHINGCVSQVWLLLLEPSLSRSSEIWPPSMSAQSSLPSATRPAKLNALLSSVTH